MRAVVLALVLAVAGLSRAIAATPSEPAHDAPDVRIATLVAWDVCMDSATSADKLVEKAVRWGFPPFQNATLRDPTFPEGSTDPAAQLAFSQAVAASVNNIPLAFSIRNRILQGAGERAVVWTECNVDLQQQGAGATLVRDMSARAGAGTVIGASTVWAFKIGADHAARPVAADMVFPASKAERYSQAVPAGEAIITISIFEYEAVTSVAVSYFWLRDN